MYEQSLFLGAFFNDLKGSEVLEYKDVEAMDKYEFYHFVPITFAVGEGTITRWDQALRKLLGHPENYGIRDVNFQERTYALESDEIDTPENHEIILSWLNDIKYVGFYIGYVWRSEFREKLEAYFPNVKFPPKDCTTVKCPPELVNAETIDEKLAKMWKIISYYELMSRT